MGFQGVVQQHLKNMVGNNASGGALGRALGAPRVSWTYLNWVPLGGVRWCFGGTIGRLEGLGSSLETSWEHLRGIFGRLGVARVQSSVFRMFFSSLFFLISA